MNTYQVQTYSNETDIHNFVLQCDQELDTEMRSIATRVAHISGIHLLGLTGPSCSGKTTAAHILCSVMEAKGKRVHTISVDDFYFSRDILIERSKNNPGGKIDFDSEDTINFELLQEKTESLLAGKETQLPCYDFQKGVAVPGEIIRPEDKDIFLYEGIQILYPKFNKIVSRFPYASILIRPESLICVGDQCFKPKQIRLLRRLVRDFRTRAASADFTFDIWDSVRENEEKNIFPYIEKCSFSIDSTLPYEIGMLKPYLETILAEVTPASKHYETAQTILKKLESVQSVRSDYMSPHSLYKEFIS